MAAVSYTSDASILSDVVRLSNIDNITSSFLPLILSCPAVQKVWGIKHTGGGLIHVPAIG